MLDHLRVCKLQSLAMQIGPLIIPHTPWIGSYPSLRCTRSIISFSSPALNLCKQQSIQVLCHEASSNSVKERVDPQVWTRDASGETPLIGDAFLCYIVEYIATTKRIKTQDYLHEDQERCFKGHRKQLSVAWWPSSIQLPPHL